MNISEVEINDNVFQLHCSGAAFWKKRKCLLISDVHFGKISHFRKYGSAVPQEAIQKNFLQLESVIQYFQPKKIYFLGDLFHSTKNLEWNLFEKWFQQQNVETVLISGNHDIISPVNYQNLGIEVIEELKAENLLLTHHPEKREGFFNVCGHLHPGFKLVGKGKQMLKFHCFYKTERQLILPAFGEFTGNFWIQPKPEDQIFICTQSEVISVN